MAEDPQPMTLQQRIASLNAAHLGRQPGEPVTFKPKPQMPDRRSLIKQKSFNIPNENVTVSEPVTANLPSGPPALPTRRPPPPLPTRQANNNQNGAEKLPRVTATRAKSEEDDTPRVKAPGWGECVLPPLPAKAEPKTRQKSFTDRPKPAARTSSISSMASIVANSSATSRTTIPPPLPSRKVSTENAQITRNIPPMPSSESLERARKASFTNGQTEKTPPLPTRRPSVVPTRQSLESISDIPPPIPTMSRPDLHALQATKPKFNAQAKVICMTCRDFSGPDNHAAQFPRQNVTSLQTLAQQLTAPFTSLTDKARAIFTWLHHNIEYNVEAFFGNRVKGSTPQSTLQTGLAVCEGYAALFTNLATYAGLESRVIVGHGKGYGYNPLGPGSPLPPYEAGHAWNVVRIDDGEWKLIDACWGAGCVQGANQPYLRRFAPERFTQSNERFGLDHFPQDKSGFYLPGGRTLTWEEYIQINPKMWPYPFEQPTIFDNATSDYSIGKETVSPPNRRISVSSGETVRFSFGLFCPHWTLENHTKKSPPPVFMLAAGGIDGRNKHYVPLEYVKGGGNGGDMWYVDVSARELGAPGETLTLFAVRSFGNRQDARGLSVREFKDGIGRMAMGFVGVAAWELV